MEQVLQEIFGERITSDPFECRQYAQDVAYIPPFLVRLLADPVPKAVVQPVDEEEISRLLRWAKQEKIPVTVRGGGSTAYFNAVPVRSGLVLDMNRLKGHLEPELDRESGTCGVWVKAGTTWKELDDGLRRLGYAVCSYPSSAYAATVGGWISMGGMGIGSLPYGPIGEQIITLRGLTAAGEIVELSRPDEVSSGSTGTMSAQGELPPDMAISLADFIGTEGTRGIITEVKLRIRPLPGQEQHLAAVFSDALATGKMLSWLGESNIFSLYNVHFTSPEFVAALQAKGYAEEIPKGYFCLAIDLDGAKEEVGQAQELIIEKIGELGGRLLPFTVGEEEWANRFKSLRTMQTYPSMQAAELLLPIRNFAAYYEGVAKMAAKTKTLTLTYAHLVSPQTLLVMTLYPSDELNTIQYIADLSFISKIYILGRALHGRPYVVGFWNTSYLGKIYPRHVRAGRWRRKQALDPHSLLNPGKAYVPSFFLNEFIFGFGMSFLGLIRPLVRKGGGE